MKFLVISFDRLFPANLNQPALVALDLKAGKWKGAMVFSTESNVSSKKEEGKDAALKALDV